MLTLILPDDGEDDAEDFISMDQAKELVSDIVQRMDTADISNFQIWLKAMTIVRDPFTGMDFFVFLQISDVSVE